MKPRRYNRRHVCQGCEQRRALFCIHGRWKADKQHTLCQQCFTAELNRARGPGQTRHKARRPQTSTVNASVRSPSILAAK